MNILPPNASPARRNAFSLVELLVVIAIIAILIAVLLPAFGAVRTQARIAATQGQFQALNTGIGLYRAEQALGGGLPPSSSDRASSTGQGTDRATITDPTKDSPTDIKVAGAHLLVHAMIGADGLGTPGFRDTDGNGIWSDDTNKRKKTQSTPAGLYSVDTEGKTEQTRYGGSGYVDEKMRERTKSLKDLYEAGKLITDPVTEVSDLGVEQLLFLDPWERPILYYKANPSALHMTGHESHTPKAGVYWQEDNAIITGGDGLVQSEGLDFGAGADEEEGHPFFHLIHDSKSPPAADPNPQAVANIAESDPSYEHTFARYIIDPSVKARPTPVQKNEYLLISAGPDGIYGSDDDVTNWTRKKG